MPFEFGDHRNPGLEGVVEAIRAGVLHDHEGGR
jgi:hypothetical protein